MNLYEYFFKGGSLRDQGTRELLLLLVDLANSLDKPLEEANILVRNLYQFCSIFAARESNLEKSKEDLIGLAEVEWTHKLAVLFFNAGQEKNAQDMPALLKETMAQFNVEHDFKVNQYINI